MHATSATGVAVLQQGFAQWLDPSPLQPLLTGLRLLHQRQTTQAREALTNAATALAELGQPDDSHPADDPDDGPTTTLPEHVQSQGGDTSETVAWVQRVANACFAALANASVPVWHAAARWVPNCD